MKKIKIINFFLAVVLFTSLLVKPERHLKAAWGLDNEQIDIVNSGFEEVYEGLIPGWTRLPEPTAVGTTVDSSTEQAFEGDRSLKIADESTTASVGAISNFIPVDAGSTYIFRAKTYVTKASVRLYLKYFDINKKEITENGSFTTLANTLNQWSDATVEGVAPEGAAFAQLWFYMGAAGVSTAYIDKVSLEKVTLTEGNIGPNYSSPIDLGEAVQVPLSQGAAYSTDAEGNNLQFFAINGSPSTFYVVNAETGERVFSQKLPGIDVVWAIDVASDGNVYFSGTTDGKLYSYIVEEQRLEVYGPIPDHKFIWDVHASEDGKVYMATYQKGEAGKVYEFDIASKSFKDLGGMQEGAEYVRGLGLDGNYLYAGVGGVKGSVVKYNLITGEKESFTVENPPTMFSDIMVVQDKILAGIGTTVYVFDKETYANLDIVKTDGKMVSPPSPYDEALVYYKVNKTELYSYNVNTLESRKIDGIPPLPATGLKDTTWITLTQGEKAGKTVLAAMAAYSDSFFFDPEDNWFSMHYPQVEAQGVLLQSLEVSPEGQVYIGGYMRGASIYDTHTERYLQNIPTFHQPEGIGFMNGKVYFGTYTGAVIYKYDPTLPFNYREDATGNPGIAYDIEEEQDRPFAIKSYGNKLIIGTIPTYGRLGGALTIYEEDGEGRLKEARVYRNVIENQSIVGVEYRDGIVYVSSYIQGGLGSTPTESEAKIAMVEEATGRVIKEVTLDIPTLTSRPTFIGSLSFGDDGLLWGVTGTDGTVFALNPDTLEVVKYKSLYPGKVHANGFRPYYIRWGQEGHMYTNVSNKLIVLDTETFQYKTLLSESVNLFGLDNVGNIYYGAGTRLKKLPIVIPVTGVSLADRKVNIKIGEVYSINPIIYPQNATNKGLIYSTSNESIATIDQEGRVVAVNKGSAIITVISEDGEFKASMEIKVIGKPNKNLK